MSPPRKKSCLRACTTPAALPHPTPPPPQNYISFNFSHLYCFFNLFHELNYSNICLWVRAINHTMTLKTTQSPAMSHQAAVQVWFSILFVYLFLKFLSRILLTIIVFHPSLTLINIMFISFKKKSSILFHFRTLTSSSIFSS